jgi:hypothetical protein
VRILRTLLAVLAAGGALAAAQPVLAGGGTESFRSDGTVRIDASRSGPLFPAGPLRIGSAARSTLIVANGGSVGGAFTLRVETGGSRALLRALWISIAPAGGRPLYRGPLADLEALNVGTLAPGARCRLVVAVSLRSTGTKASDDGLQGLTARADLSWSAVAA